MKKSLLSALPLLASLLVPALASAADPVAAPALKPLAKPITIKFCIFDIMGTTGDAFSYAKDLALEAKKWGVNADLRAYTDERVAAEDFKAGQCDGVAISTMRAKQFNFFIGSIDSPGALPSWRHVRELIASLANPKLAPLTISGPYQVAAVIPLGGAYVMVNDRQINSIEKAAGKKVAVLDFDKAQAKIVQSLGAQPVASDITNFAGKFNNGQVDIIAAPAVAFKPLELYKGLGTQGAIFRFPLAQITATILIRRDKFIKDVPDFDERVQKMREFALSKLDVVERMVNASEADIPKKYWLDLSKADQEKYIRLMREVRVNMTKDGMYDKKMMSLMKKVRCRIEPANEECSMNLE